jgi:hypothetical protein
MNPEWDGAPPGPQEVQVLCGCTRRFNVPKSLKGGMTNCPGCGKAVPVRGGPEPLFWVLLGGGCAFVLLASLAIGALGGLTAGLISLGVGAAIILAVVLAS